MPSSYIGYAVNFGHEVNDEKVKVPCGHWEDHDEIVTREDGTEVCRDCDTALEGFEKAFGEEAELVR